MDLSWLERDRKCRWVCALVACALVMMTRAASGQGLEDLSSFTAITTANEHSVPDRINRTVTSTVDITVSNSSTRSLLAPLHGVIDLGGAAVQSVELEALDPQGAAATQSFTVNVTATNLPPEFTSVPKRVAKVGEAYVYAATAHDPEGATMTFSLASDPPAGLTVNGGSGAVAWTPGAQDVGPTTWPCA